MKKIFLLLGIAIPFISLTQEQPGVPLDQLEHPYMQGYYVDTLGNRIEGEIKYSEQYANHFFFRAGTEKYEKIEAISVNRIVLADSLTFYSFKGSLHDKVNSENKISIYRKFIPKGVLGGTISGGKVLGEYHYYVTIENVTGFKSISDVSFMPFHKKVPPLLVACQELSKKVENKEKGYSKSVLIPELELWKKIAREYEACVN